ncbi:SIR2 family protein [Leptospira ainazelensis]|uniref:SIR2 family protein n=1 Tax=Leptospira ainazelensis TaxID=2810034 RepID=UPI0019647DF7|nr:SIR2 family protein [Leptospira ainazelensis]
MKKKLLIVVGAGASIEFGMPSVSAVDTLFEKWALGKFALDNQVDSLYSFLKERLSEYYKNQNNNNYVNFEELLYVIFSLSSHLNPLSNNSLKAFLNPINFPKVNRYNKYIAPDQSTFRDLYVSLIDELLNHFREQCIDLNNNKQPELSLLKKFIEKLKDQFEIAIISLNYDNIFLQADPSLDVGFNKYSGAFDKDYFIDSGKWNYLIQLHGSVHFDMKMNEGSMHSISWENNLKASFSQNASGRNEIKTSEGISLPTSSIISGYFKLNQMLRDPFFTYYNKSFNFPRMADSILFIGYGFNDHHLNFSISRLDPNVNQKIVLIDFSSKNQNSMHFRNDSWAGGVCSCLKLNGHNFSFDNYNHPADIQELKKENKFEIYKNDSNPRHVSIWHNGFLSALQNGDKILSQLT